VTPKATGNQTQENEGLTENATDKATEAASKVMSGDR